MKIFVSVFLVKVEALVALDAAVVHVELAQLPHLRDVHVVREQALTLILISDHKFINTRPDITHPCNYILSTYCFLLFDLGS